MATHHHQGIVKAPESVPLQLQITCTESFLAIPASKIEVGLWKLSELDKRPVCLRGHTSDITALSFGNERNPTLICSASEDSIFVWKIEDAFINFNTGEPTTGAKIADKLGNCQHLCFSPDDAYMAACIHSEVWIISLVTCNLVATLEGHTSAVTGSIFCPHDWSTFVTISEDRTFKVWDIETASLEYQSSIISSSPFLSLAMHPEHKHFAVGTADGILRVYDLTSHRILNEINIALVLQKQKPIGSGVRRNSEEKSKPQVISSLPSWQQSQNQQSQNTPDETSADDIEEGCAILGLFYWWEDQEESPNGRRNSLIKSPRRNSLLDRDATVREVFKDPPFLVVGCTSTLILLNANNMEIVHRLDLNVPLICAILPEPEEYHINTAGSYAFTRSQDTKQTICVIGSMFESIGHVLNIQPDRTAVTLEPHAELRLTFDSSPECLVFSAVGKNDDLSEESFVLSDISSDQPGEESQLLTEGLTVLSRAPLLENSPLRAELVPKEKPRNATTGKKVNSRNAKDKMNQPLTFHSKVKSSGYTAAPRVDVWIEFCCGCWVGSCCGQIPDCLNLQSELCTSILNMN